MRPDLREWRRCGNHIAQEKHKPRHPTTEPNPLRREENLGKCSQQGLLWRQSSEDCAPRAGGYSRSLVGELSPHMPHGVAENQNLQSAVSSLQKEPLGTQMPVSVTACPQESESESSSVMSHSLRPHGPTIPGILQARILEWVAFPFSKGSSQPRD